MKHTLRSSISPFTLSIVIPDSSLGSIFDFWSNMAKIEAVAAFALDESGAKELDWEIVIAAIVREKKTCKACDQ